MIMLYRTTQHALGSGKIVCASRYNFEMAMAGVVAVPNAT